MVYNNVPTAETLGADFATTVGVLVAVLFGEIGVSAVPPVVVGAS
jgi:hypothetical protein